MATILQSALELIKKSLDGDLPNPPLPTVLVGFGTGLDALTNLSVDVTGKGISDWLDKLAEITDDPILHDTLIVRTIQVHAPRVAELLVLARIVTVDFPDGVAQPDQPDAFHIDWPKFNQWLKTPDVAGSSALFDSVKNLKDVKALQALILAGFTAPDVLVRDLEYPKQGFSALSLQDDDIVASLDQLINKINSPLRFPIPPPVGADYSSFVGLRDLVGQTAEGVAGWISLDGPASLPGADLQAPADPDDLAVELHLKDAGSYADKSVDLDGGWKVAIKAKGAGVQTYRLQFKADGSIDTVVRPTADLSLAVERQPDPDGAALLIGKEDDTNLRINTLGASLDLHSAGSLFAVDLHAKQITLTLKPEFLKFIAFGFSVPDSIKLESDIGIAYDQVKGLIWKGEQSSLPGFALNQIVPLGLKIGSSGAGASIDQMNVRLTLGIGESGLTFAIEQRFDATGSVGPLKMSLEGTGFSIGRGGRSFGAITPKGIGLVLKAGPVDGGGFLQFISDTEFAGALQLKVLGIGAFAYGVYQTLTGGQLSFAALIGIRLPLPGIQISFGFAISGMGGLVGINRRADTDLLRERLTSGSAGDVLFNDNPAANAPRLLSDMRQFFPAEPGVFLVGPTLQINWIQLLKLDVGVFIELPGPRKIFIAGSARLVLGSEEFAIVYLRADFIGGVDFTKSLIFFDAALVNSQVLGIFKITGGVALRISYGSNSYFLFTVGGFNPNFNPGSMEMPKVARVGVSYDIGVVWLKNEMYLAITSNTFQLGTRVEAGLDLGPIGAHGWFGFDAIIQFKPFHFEATVDAGFDIEVAGESLCNVRVHGLLSGPGPLVLHAEASVKILFVRISGDITVTLSDNPGDAIAPITSVTKLLEKELGDANNLRIDGIDASVQFLPLDPKGSLKYFSPVASLVWEQKVTPLNINIDRLQGANLDRTHNVKVIRPDGSAFDPESDWFGVGAFRKLSDSEALNLTRFEEHPSGIRIKAADPKQLDHSPNFETLTIDIEVIKLPKKIWILGGSFLIYISDHLSLLMADHQQAKMPTQQPKVKVNPETWVVHGGGTASTVTMNQVEAFVAAKSMSGFSASAVDKPLAFN